MPFELHIQIGVGKATGAPMLLGHDVSRLWSKLGAELAAPRSIFKSLSRPGCFLNGRGVLPGLVVARTVSMMHRIENPQSRRSRCGQQLQHVSDAVIRLSNGFNAIP